MARPSFDDGDDAGPGGRANAGAAELLPYSLARGAVGRDVVNETPVLGLATNETSGVRAGTRRLTDS